MYIIWWQLLLFKILFSFHIALNQIFVTKRNLKYFPSLSRQGKLKILSKSVETGFHVRSIFYPLGQITYDSRKLYRCLKLKLV